MHQIVKGIKYDGHQGHKRETLGCFVSFVVNRNWVNCCFWHGCPVHANMPSDVPRNNQEFWRKKVEGNKIRNRFVMRELRKMGWSVVRVWDFVS